MNALLAFLVSLQSTLGPSFLLNDQEIVNDHCLDCLSVTVYAPTTVAKEVFPPVGEAVAMIADMNRDVFRPQKPNQEKDTWQRFWFLDQPDRMQASPEEVYYLKDDIQYFPQGHEFKLQSEAAALRAANRK